MYGFISFKVAPFLHGVSDIKDRMTRWTNKKPSGAVLTFFKGGVKTVLVTALRANLELICNPDLVDLSLIHI